MAQTLGQTPVGTIVKIPENGTPTDFIVVQQGNPNPSIYSTTFNNGTWLSRNLLTTAINNGGSWDADQGGSWYNGTYKSRIEQSIRDAILTVKVPYYKPGTWDNVPVTLENGYQTQVFVPSFQELGLSAATDRYVTGFSSRLQYWTGSNSSGPNTVETVDDQGDPRTTSQYWLRGYYVSTGSTRNIIQAGNKVGTATFDYYATRPCFLLPQDMTVLDDGTVSLGAVPVSSNAISISLIFMQGQPMNMTWQASPNADSYIVQRKSSADADWVQVQSGSGLSFSETVGSTWTTVQYRIAAVRDGNNSPWTETQVYNVVSTSSLLISGEDGSLGTIDSDVHYSVTSDTGNQITLTRLVNNVQVYTGQVSSGFTYDIPIVELPTGEGTIVINASVQTAGGLVSQSRTWTYTKTAMTFSTVGGISELDQNNQAVWPKTVMEAIRTYQFMGGTLDKTLMTLANAVIRDPDTGAFVDFEGQGIDAPQILVGSYVGTGGNTVTINTPFEPIAIFIYPQVFSSSLVDGLSPFTSFRPMINLMYGEGSGYHAYPRTLSPVSWGENNIVIQNTASPVTMTTTINAQTTYYYLILGGSKTN